MVANAKKPESMAAYRQQRRIPEREIVTLNTSSLRLLESIGVMDIIESKYLTRFDDIIVNEQVGRSFMHFNSKNQIQNSKLV